MPDSKAKKEWDKKNVKQVNFKMFRKVGERENDQSIIDYLDKSKNRSEVIKSAIREYMKNHPGESR